MKRFLILFLIFSVLFAQVIVSPNNGDIIQGHYVVLNLAYGPTDISVIHNGQEIINTHTYDTQSHLALLYIQNSGDYSIKVSTVNENQEINIHVDICNGGTIKITYTHNGNPIDDARVIITDNSDSTKIYTAYTNDDGIALVNVSSGQYHVSVKKSGYESQEYDVNVCCDHCVSPVNNNIHLDYPSSVCLGDNYYIRELDTHNYPISNANVSIKSCNVAQLKQTDMEGYIPIETQCIGEINYYIDGKYYGSTNVLNCSISNETENESEIIEYPPPTNITNQTNNTMNETIYENNSINETSNNEEAQGPGKRLNILDYSWLLLLLILILLFFLLIPKQDIKVIILTKYIKDLTEVEFVKTRTNKPIPNLTFEVRKDDKHYTSLKTNKYGRATILTKEPGEYSIIYKGRLLKKFKREGSK